MAIYGDETKAQCFYGVANSSMYPVMIKTYPDNNPTLFQHFIMM